MEEKIVYNVSEIKVMLGVSKKIAYELIHSKGFPKINVGKRILIPKEAFNEWLKEKSSY